MAITNISDEYLGKVRFAVRRNQSEKIDSELKDIIEQCRLDMILKGVPEKVAVDEKNKAVLGCQRAFARWQFGINGDEAVRNRDDYRIMLDELRKNCISEEET